jgi:hypothetical protein
MVPGNCGRARFDCPDRSNIDQRIADLEARLVPAARLVVQSAQSHDWGARATEMIAEARKMPLGQRRSDALGEAGRLRIAAEMKRWSSTK